MPAACLAAVPLRFTTTAFFRLAGWLAGDMAGFLAIWRERDIGPVGEPGGRAQMRHMYVRMQW